MCIYMYTCTYIHIYYVCVCTYTHVYVCAYASCMCVHTCVLQLCLFREKHVRAHAQCVHRACIIHNMRSRCARTNYAFGLASIVYDVRIHVCIHVCTHTYMRTLCSLDPPHSLCIHTQMRFVHVAHACMYRMM